MVAVSYRTPQIACGSSSSSNSRGRAALRESELPEGAEVLGVVGERKRRADETTLVARVLRAGVAPEPAHDVAVVAKRREAVRLVRLCEDIVKPARVTATHVCTS